MLPLSTRARDEEESLFMKPTKKSDTKPKQPETSAKKEPVVRVVSSEAKDLMMEFASGKRKGKELKAWVEEKRASLPMIDQLVYNLLMELEKLNPDPDCKWAEPSNLGAGLLALVEDDIVGQMQVLWAYNFTATRLDFSN